MVRPRYFAVGLKGWVEIRQHTQPLKELKSEAKVRVKRSIPNWDWYSPDYGKAIEREEILTLKQVVWQGGKILRTIKTSQFKYRAGFQVGKDKCVELTVSTVRKVLKDGSSSRS